MTPDDPRSAVTRGLHHRVSVDGSAPVVTPLFQCSAFLADSPYFYTRKANPNNVELEGALAILEEASHVISTTTGMSALTLALGLLEPGATLEAGSPADLAFWGAESGNTGDPQAPICLVAIVRAGAFASGDEHMGPFPAAAAR